MQEDLEQAMRNFLDGLQTIRMVAEGLQLDAQDLVDQIGLKTAQNAQDLEESRREDRGRDV